MIAALNFDLAEIMAFSRTSTAADRQTRSAETATDELELLLLEELTCAIAGKVMPVVTSSATAAINFFIEEMERNKRKDRQSV